MTTIYVAIVTGPVTKRSELYVIVPSLKAAKDGFWINDEEQYAYKGTGARWVPPSAIAYIQKDVE